MTLKEIKALAKVCRESGISFFKNAEIEFSVEPTFIPKATRKRKEAEPLSEFEKAVLQTQQNPVKAVEPIKADTPSELEILFWSSGGAPEDEAGA